MPCAMTLSTMVTVTAASTRFASAGSTLSKTTSANTTAPMSAATQRSTPPPHRRARGARRDREGETDREQPDRDGDVGSHRADVDAGRVTEEHQCERDLGDAAA